MSWPFSSRSVATIPCCRRIEWKRSCRAARAATTRALRPCCTGSGSPWPTTVAHASPSSCACSSLSFTSAIRMYSKIIRRLPRDVVVASLEQTSSGYLRLTGMIWLAHLVGRAVQRKGEPELRRLIRELADLRREPAGRDGDVPRADAEAPRRVDDLIARIRFARFASGSPIPMKTTLSIFSPLCCFDRHQLLHDLAGVEIARPAVEPARAKLAAVGAADLGGDADRPAIRAFAVKRRRGGDQHRLDQVPVAQAEEKFLRRVFRAEHAHDVGFANSNSSAS